MASEVRSSLSERQSFTVVMLNRETGERLSVVIQAYNAVAALRKMLRRRGCAEALLSGQLHKFIVTENE